MIPKKTENHESLLLFLIHQRVTPTGCVRVHVVRKYIKQAPKDRLAHGQSSFSLPTEQGCLSFNQDFGTLLPWTSRVCNKITSELDRARQPIPEFMF